MARQFGSIRKLPSGRYQARYRSPDTGALAPAPTTFTTKKAASAWLAEVQTSIEKGVWKSPEQITAEKAAVEAARESAITVRQLADMWIATIPSINHRSSSTARVRRFIIPELGDIAVTELTKSRCVQWVADMETRLCPGAPTQRVRTYGALSTMLNLAVRQDIIDRSPLRIRGLLADRPAREPQTATVDEVDRLASAMPAELAMTVRLAAWCGLRMGEVLGLQVSDIVEDTAVTGEPTGVVRLRLRRHVIQGRGSGTMVVLDGTKSSDGRPEYVVVPPHLAPALREHVERHSGSVAPRWLFPDPRKPKDLPRAISTIDRRWRQARAACGLDHLHFHDLRRTGNTLAALAGATLGEMKQRLRHRTSDAAERYIVAARGADVDLAARMSRQAERVEMTPEAAVAAAVEAVEAAVAVLGESGTGDAAEALATQLEAAAAQLRGEGSAG